MEQGLKELNEQLQGLIVGEKETKKMWRGALDSELKILLNDTLDIIGEHREYLEEEVLFLKKQVLSYEEVEGKLVNRLSDVSSKFIDEDKNIARGAIYGIELAIDLIDNILKNEKIRKEFKVKLEEIKSKYYYMDSELENYIQRINNGEL
ncbi:hypothetical protein [Clostridium sp.]|uniref:hypothetical protein n=1 Tax=Clostridium sp. TaxID=1506 RepID=UPI00399433F4